MEAGAVSGRARQEADLTLRGLARRAGTSHATISAYESGRKVPTVETLDRIVRAAGFDLDGGLRPRMRGTSVGEHRGDELAAVLDLAEEFPARHDRVMAAPIFPRP